MYKPHYGTCLGPCGKDNQLLPVKDGFCQICNHERKQAKKKSKSSPPKKKNYFATPPQRESDIFLEIWQEREHKCFVCGKPIYQPIAANFAHILAKALNKFPLFKLQKSNIELMCYDLKSPSCHFKWDNYPRSELVGDGWERMFKKETELKEEYGAYKLERKKQNL